MSSMKLAVVLRFGRSAVLTADCSPATAVRRARILDAARPSLAERLPLFRETGPGGWLLVSEIRLGQGALTVTEEHETWLRDALSSLGRMYASRDAV